MDKTIRTKQQLSRTLNKNNNYKNNKEEFKELIPLKSKMLLFVGD